MHTHKEVNSDFKNTYKRVYVKLVKVEFLYVIKLSLLSN